jgi:hypothetical protein
MSTAIAHCFERIRIVVFAEIEFHLVYRSGTLKSSAFVCGAWMFWQLSSNIKLSPILYETRSFMNEITASILHVNTHYFDEIFIKFNLNSINGFSVQEN